MLPPSTASALPDRLDRAGAWLTILFPFALLAGQAAADIAGCVLAALFLLRSAVTRDFGWLRATWVRIALALWFYGIARSFFTPDPLWSLNRALPWGRYILMGIAFAFWSMRLPNVFPRMMKLLFVTVAFLVLDGLFQAVMGYDVFGREIKYAGPETHRLTGPYGKPILGMMLAWLGLPALAWLYSLSPAPLRYYAASALLVLTVFLSGERMALLLTCAGIIGFIWLVRARYRNHFLLAGLIVFLTAATLFWREPAVQRQLMGLWVSVSEITQTHYYGIWASGVELWLQQPFFGIGIDRFVLDCPALYGEESIVSSAAMMHCAEHLHHLYLEWLVYGGLIALALWIALLASWLRQIFRTRNEWWLDPVAAAWVIVFLLRIFPLSTSSTLYTSWTGIPFWFIAAATLVACTGAIRKTP